MRKGLAGRSGVRLLFLALVLGIPARLRAPQELPSSASTIRSQAAEVLVDVVVTDHKNRLISNLLRQDFLLYEDGVPQQITSFRFYHGAPETPGTATVPSGAPPESVQPAGLAGREAPSLTILLLDYSTTQFEHQKLVREASIKYVEEKFRPTDLMAVFVLGAGLRFLSDFTNDRNRLLAALRGTEARGSSLAAERASLTAGIEAGQSEAAQTTGVNSSGVSLSGAGAAGAGAAIGSQGTGAAAAMIARRIAAQFYTLRSALDKRQGRDVLTAIRAIALGVKGIEGRKSLVLFSEGFVVGPELEGELYSVVDLANRFQVAVYGIDSQGLETRELTRDLAPRDELTSIASSLDRKEPMGGETGFDRIRQAGRDMRESALRYVANATGGFLIRNTNDLRTALARVDQEMRSYYQLSYRPTNQNYDGRFRQIRVEARPSGLNVRARSGYYAIPTGFELLTPDEYQLLARARSAGASAPMPLFFRVAGFQDQGGQYRVPIILEVPTTAIRFNQVGGMHSARVQIMGLVRDGAGRAVTRFGGPLRFNATEAEYNVLRVGSVSFLDALRLPLGTYSFEVVLKDLQAETIAYGLQGIHLREPEPGLALSAILLAKDVDKAPSTGSKFLSIEGVKILPSARCQFRNGDKLIFYFDIYHPKFDPQREKADVSVELSLVREGRLVNVRLPSFRLNEYDSAPVPHITLARYLQLASLAPGNYTLVVEVKDALVNQTARAQAAFSVVD